MFSIKNSSKSYCSWRWQIRQIPLGGRLSRVPTLCSAFFTCWVLLTQTNSGDTAVMGVPEASQGRAERSPEAVHHQGQSDHPHFYPNIPPLGISQAPSCQQAKQTGYIPHWQRVWPHLFSPVLSPTLWPLWPAHLALDTLGIWASCVTPSSGLEWPSWSYSEHFQLWPTWHVPAPVTYMWLKLPCAHFPSTSPNYKSIILLSVTCVPGRYPGDHIVQLSHSSDKKTEA